MSSEKNSRSVALELDYVREVYDRIGYDLSYAEDPLKNTVNKFLDNLEPGSIIADIGCGDGRHLRNAKGYYSVGADCSMQQIQLSRQRCQEAILGSNLYLPLRSESMDGVLSVAMIHHLSTKQRRIQALQELARVMRIGARVLITVQIRDPQHTQDVLMPWYDVLNGKKTKEDSLLTQDSGEGDLEDQSDDSIRSSDEDQDIIAKINYSQKLSQKLDKKSRSLDYDFQYSDDMPHNSDPMQVCYNFVRKAFRRLSSTGSECISNNTVLDMVDSANAFPPTEMLDYQFEKIDDGTIAWDNSIQEEVDSNYIELLNIDEEVEVHKVLQTKSIDQTHVWCYSSENVPKLKYRQKQNKSKGLIRSISDAFKTIPSLWSTRDVESCSDLKSHTISLQDIAKEGNRNKKNLVRSRTTATCNSSFDAFQTLEEIREIEMTVGEAEKIIDSFLESSVSKIETVKPKNKYQSENECVDFNTNADIINGNISPVLDGKYISRNFGTLSHQTDGLFSSEIDSKYPDIYNRSAYLNKHKKCLDYSKSLEECHSTNDELAAECKYSNEVIEENGFVKNRASAESYFSAKKEKYLEMSDLNKLPLYTNLNNANIKCILQCNENHKDVPNRNNFLNRNEGLESQCLCKRIKVKHSNRLEQLQNLPSLKKNTQSLDSSKPNKLRINRKYRLRTSSVQNISSKHIDCLLNTFYWAPYPKLIGPFYDTEPGENIFLSSYMSMPELYNLSDFSQEYCIYKCMSKSRTSWNLFHSSIENPSGLPSNSIDKVNNGDLFLNNSTRDRRRMKHASKKHKKNQRVKMLQNEKNTATLKNFSNEDVSENWFDGKLISNQNPALDTESILKNLSSRKENMSQTSDKSKAQIATDINGILDCSADVLCPKTSLSSDHKFRDSNDDGMSSASSSESNFSNLDNTSSSSTDTPIWLTKFSTFQKTIQDHPEFQKKYAERTYDRSFVPSGIHIPRDTISGTEIVYKQDSDLSKKSKCLKRQTEDFTSYSRVVTVARNFSLNMSETMYNQHIDKKCELCMKLTNDNQCFVQNSAQQLKASPSQDCFNLKFKKLEKTTQARNARTKLFSDTSLQNFLQLDHKTLVKSFPNYISETHLSERHISERSLPTQNGATPKNSSLRNNHPSQEFKAEKQYTLNSATPNSGNKVGSLSNHNQSFQSPFEEAQNKLMNAVPQNINYLYGQVHEEGATVTMHRYHHLFEQNELDDLIENFVDDLHILETFKDQYYWCIIAEKVRVWTI